MKKTHPKPAIPHPDPPFLSPPVLHMSGFRQLIWQFQCPFPVKNQCFKGLGTVEKHQSSYSGAEQDFFLLQILCHMYL